MKKKALKYTIFLLLIPIIITIMLSLVQDKGMETNNQYDGIDIPEYKDTRVDDIKRSSTYAYISIFSLLFISGGTWIYVKKKGGF